MLIATTIDYYGGRDLVVVKNDYFGVLEEIVGLDYFQNNQIVRHWL